MSKDYKAKRIEDALNHLKKSYWLIKLTRDPNHNANIRLDEAIDELNGAADSLFGLRLFNETPESELERSISNCIHTLIYRMGDERPDGHQDMEKWLKQIMFRATQRLCETRTDGDYGRDPKIPDISPFRLLEPQSIIRVAISESGNVFSDHTYVGEFPIFLDTRPGFFEFKEDLTNDLSECLILTFIPEGAKESEYQNWLFWGDGFTKNHYENMDELPLYFVPYFITGANKLAPGAPTPEIMKILEFIQESKRSRYCRVFIKDIKHLLKKND